MSDSKKIANLLAVARKEGLAVPEVAADRLNAYVDLLRIWNRHTQLVSRNDQREFVALHLAECFAPACVFDFSTIKRMIDFGSGAGLPGLPLAILFPHLQVALLESKRKKTRFLAAACVELKLDNVEILACHSDEIESSNFYHYHAVIARAVARLAKLWGMSARLLAPNGVLLAMKGGELTEELHELQGVPSIGKIEIKEYPDALVEPQKKRKLIIVHGTSHLR